MTHLMELVKTRRSIRKYQDKPVSEESLNTLLEAVQWAPSWTNCQCWEVVVVKDPAIRQRLQETLAPKNPATKAIVNAPILLALCGVLKKSGYYNGVESTKHGDWFMYDLGLATQNLCLAAQSMGLGTVIVGLFDHDRAKAVLNAPDGMEVVTLIPAGYPAKASKAPERRKITEFTHYDTF